MKIAVIVPIYNVERYLARCVNSILCQTYKNFVLILVDDGSPDNCGKICDDYAKRDSRIHVIHQRNGGLSAARNAGIDWTFEQSNIDAITFVDSDDWIVPQYLEKLLYGINLGADISCALYSNVGQDGIVHHHHRSIGWKLQTPEEYWLDEESAACIAWGKLFLKNTFRSTRFPVGRIHEDMFTTHKLVFAANKIASSTTELYNYFLRANSITNLPWTLQRLDKIDALLSQQEYFQKHNFKRAENYVTIRLLSALRNAIANTKISHPDIAQKYKSLFSSARHRQLRIPFWENRDYYRETYPKVIFVPMWIANMLFNFAKMGRNSWLVKSSIPMLRQAFFDFTH